MLSQETGQRPGRDRFQEAAGRFVAGVASAGKDLGWAFTRLEILYLGPSGRAREETRQKRDRRKDARSAQHSQFSRKTLSSAHLAGTGGVTF